MTSKRLRVAVIGTGNIGADLCERLLQDKDFKLTTVIGRRDSSTGLQRFQGRVPNIGAKGIDSLIEFVDDFDGVFDATSAYAHSAHWNFLQVRNKFVIDLTPSKIGIPTVPVLINFYDSLRVKTGVVRNHSMVTCGGQSSAPLIHAMTRAVKMVSNVEVSSSISSKSAGPATRLNIDQYVDSTENLATLISGTKNTKAILVLNPAEPPVMMRTTVHLKGREPDLEIAQEITREMESLVRQYVPGYEIVVEPHLTDRDTISATAKVTGAGFFLPSYAGNLDIINAAGVETARKYLNEETLGGSK
jgi:acetaldehyde dehydrogenase (acetylating)